MNLKKAAAIAAAAGALAAISAPAMAFDNEFHGLFNFNSVFTNMGTSGDITPGATTWGEKKKMNNYMEHRVRLQYIGKASDDLKLVTHFEVNTRYGARNNVTGTTGNVDMAGGDLDGDGTNIVTKHAYLDFNIGNSFNTKLGLQAYKDQLKGLFIDADVPAVMTATKLGAYTLGLGFARYNDMASQGNTVTRLGELNTDLFIMDNSYALNKDTKLGLSYYFLADYTLAQQEKYIHTFGLNGATKIAGIDLSGVVAMQAGHQKNTLGSATGGTTKTLGENTNYHGWVANVNAKAKVGVGTAKAGFLFASGDNSEKAGSNHGWQTTGINSYNDSGMMILARNTYHSPTSTNTYIRTNVTNIALATIGYDAQLSEKFNLNGNVGLAWAPASGNYAGYRHTNSGTSRVNPGDFMGTEINVEAGYQLYKNLKVMAQGGYVVLGAYYKDTQAGAENPENPYTMRLQARYSF